VTVTWQPAAPTPPVNTAYHVYEVDGPSQTLLTPKPVAEDQYADSRMTWGATRCYSVRAIETVDALTVESEASPPACVMLADTFPPAAPKGLQAVATEGVINLIWDANTEADLDGYILLRGPAPGDELVPITTALIRETAFQDRVPPGQRFVYALQAVDRSGNLSPFSVRTEESAR
jgi:predicted phage tail protein